MHIESALIATSVATVAAVSQGGVLKNSLKKLKEDLSRNKVRLMITSGALVFAAQMINFTIPGTGSSGHIVGGILLAMLLGPHAAFIVLSSILAVQSLVFMDGGLLALGCNIFNMAFISCYVVYPLIVRPILSKIEGRKGIITAVIFGNIAALFLGATSVCIETYLSGITELPINDFIGAMIPIHLVIGLIEGLITSAILLTVMEVDKTVLDYNIAGKSINTLSINKLNNFLAIAAVIAGTVLSAFASAFPDGLEWSILKVAGETEFIATDSVHVFFNEIQSSISILADYAVSGISSSIGTSIAGIIGVLLTGALIALIFKNTLQVK